MRILHVSGWLAPRYGGSSAVVLGSASSVAALGNHVDVVTTNADGIETLDVPLGRMVTWQGANVTFHPVARPRRYLTSWSMLQDLRSRIADYDVVHIHSLYRFHTVAAAITARRAGVPYMIQAHGSLDPWHRGHRRRAKDLHHALLEDSVIRGAAGLLCTSRQEEQAIRDLGYRVPTWVVPVGVDIDALRVPTPSDRLPALRGLETDAKVIVFLGRISAKKGLDILVEAFREIRRTVPTAYLIIAGPDDEGIVERLTPEIAESGLADRIKFIGTIGGDEKVALLQRADVMVLPSADESFGIVVLEGMAVGCPMVITPGVALHEVVRVAGAGLVAARSPHDLAGAICSILEDPGRAAAMGRAGMELVDRRYSWPQVATELMGVYEAVAGFKSTSTAAVELPLVCPACRSALTSSGNTLECPSCQNGYPIIDGIPVMVPDLAMIDHDEIDHHHGSHDHAATQTHKAAQADHFDRSVAEEFEIERPHGTPRWYRFLLDEKFRRAVRPIGAHLAGSTALTVCGGSGMDAEYLARKGARVVSTDLSIGAARRVRERARRHNLEITPVVADIERLPFADGSFDVVLVHDGLHHLERPAVGLAEMARVARRWVSVSEPAKAFATDVAVKAGVALDREEAGNRVERLRPEDVAAQLATLGMRPVYRERYAMVYPHEPGRVFRAFSTPGVFHVVRAGWRLGNSMLGRRGNKMVVVVDRDED